MTGPLVLENDVLRVTVDPLVGGTITAIVHKGIGASVLGTVPWDPLRQPEPGLAAASETIWLTRFTGGWPLLFPNGGDACEFNGVFHGFHGEGSVATWRAEVTPERIRLTRAFHTVPVRMTRDLTLEGDTLCLTETAISDGPEEVPVIWGQHVTFGSDMLDGPVIVETGARRVVVDDAYDPPANPWRPGAAGTSPVVDGKSGTADLSRPEGPLAAMAYLTDFERPFVSIRRVDGSFAAVLSWRGEIYDSVWYWCELGGTTTAPWYGRGRLIGLEPISTFPGRGLTEAARRGARMLRLFPGQPLTGSVGLRVFRPQT
jgi:hypothetical protein